MTSQTPKQEPVLRRFRVKIPPEMLNSFLRQHGEEVNRFNPNLLENMDIMEGIIRRFLNNWYSENRREK